MCSEVPAGGLGGSIHLGIFLRIHHGCDRDTEVGDWAPEICGEWTCQPMIRLVSKDTGVVALFDVRVEQT